MDKIKLRQICFLFAALMPATKLIVYPATLSHYAKNDLLLSAALNFLLMGAVLAAVLALARRTDLTFFELLQNTFGKAFARIVYGAFALFFAFSALLPLMEQKGFVTQVFYENIPSVIAFAPLFGVSFFACVKGFKTIGRAADIALPVFWVCFAVIVLLALPEADFSALLPVGGAGAGVFRGSLYGLNWYTDCLYPLFFLGHFERERGAWWKAGLAFLAGAAAVLLFLGTFYGIFADIAVRQQNAVAQVSKYTTAFTSLGRIDLLFIFAVALVLVFAMCLPAQLSVHCARKALGDIRPLLPSAALNLLLLVFIIFFKYSYLKLQTFFTQKLWPVFLFFAYVVPFFAIFLRKRPRGAKAWHGGMTAQNAGARPDEMTERPGKEAERGDSAERSAGERGEETERGAGKHSPKNKGARGERGKGACGAKEHGAGEQDEGTEERREDGHA